MRIYNIGLSNMSGKSARKNVRLGVGYFVEERSMREKTDHRI